MQHAPPHGGSAVWKQLALALTCADLWLGSWCPATIVSTSAWPVAVCFELLTLPTELLFSERALPLNDVGLWQTAAQALLDACPLVFAHICKEITPGIQNGDARIRAKSALCLLGKWLRATRMSFEWGPPCEETEPLRQLAVHKERLVALAASAPEEAVDVAQQLARWRKCDSDLVPLLQELLNLLFHPLCTLEQRTILIPLLEDLASDRWPRAVLGEIALDWQAITQQAIALLPASLFGGEDGYCEVEGSLLIWQTFAKTVQNGTHEWFDDQVIRPSGGGPHSEWSVSYEKFSRIDALPQIFGILCHHLILMLRVPAAPTIDVLRSCCAVRDLAQDVILCWVGLIGNTPMWKDATWQPLKVAMQHLSAFSAGTAVTIPESVAQEVEVLLWLAATLASNWPEAVGPAPVVRTPHELDVVDRASDPWLTLLQSAACSLVASVPAKCCPDAIEWILRRPAYATNLPCLLEITELACARALSDASQRLSSGPMHMSVAERILALMLTDVPSIGLHSKSSNARAMLLQALRHVMGKNTTLLCEGLKTQVLPLLRDVADSEAAVAANQRNPQWHAARTFFATLTAILPKTVLVSNRERPHPEVLLLREQRPTIEAALLRWPPAPDSDQPLASAVEFVASAVPLIPALLPEMLQLLFRSVTQSLNPELQLDGLCNIMSKVPCPHGEQVDTARLLVETIITITEFLAGRSEILRNPRTLSSLFKILETAISEAPSLCGGFLRQRLLSHVTHTSLCMHIIIETLPSTSMPEAIENMFRFAKRLLSTKDLQELPGHHDMILSILPQLCVALFCSLATQEHYSAWNGLINVGDWLCFASKSLPNEFHVALTNGLQSITGLSEWSQAQMVEHVENHAQWPSRSVWLAGLQQIVQQWQSERRQTPFNTFA